MRNFLAFFATLLFGGLVLAQTTYGLADFSRSDVIPKDGLIDLWDLTRVNMSGDLLSGAGDMESGSTSGGCTYCPTGATCSCTGNSLLDSEASLLYKNNASLKFTSGSSGTCRLQFRVTTTPGIAYQVTFKILGAAGTEDMYFYIQGSDGKYYVQTTDVWQAGSSSRVFSSLATTWTTYTVYVLNDTAARTYFDVSFTNNTASKTFYIDDVQIQQYRDGPTIKGMKNNMTQTVSGNVSFGQATNAVSRPNQSNDSGMYGGYFDGSDSSLFVADNAIYEPATYGNKFSWGCRDVVPATENTASKNIFSKDAMSNRSYWFNNYSPTGATCDITKDGSTDNYTSSISTAVTGQKFDFVCTYSGLSDGASILAGYTNKTTTTKTNAVFPIFNGTAASVIGASGAGTSSEHTGSIGSCALWGKTLSAIEAAKWISPHFPGPTETTGLWPTACTHTAPEATCGYDRCRDGTPNACQVQGTGVQAVFGAATELAPNNSFETFTGTDAAPTITGWTREFAVGSPKITLYRPAAKHGNVGLRFKTNAPTDDFRSVSSCIAVSGNTDYYVSGTHKILSGSITPRLLVIEFTGASCTSAGNSTIISTTGINGVVGQKFTTAAGTIGAKIYINSQVTNSMYDVVWDTISLKQKSYHTPWFHNSGTGTTSSTAKTYTLNNPLAEKRKDGVSAYLNGFCFGTWVWTPYGGSDTATREVLYNVPGGAQLWKVEKFGITSLVFFITDSVSGQKYSLFTPNDTNFTANSWKYITGCTNNAGTVSFAAYNTNNSTWYTGTPGGAGTGVHSTAASQLYFGSNNGSTQQMDAYFHNLVITPYASPNPLPGFTNRPTNRPY